jgi:GntR family transcriptional regulator/MocR family aminotransferase
MPPIKRSLGITQFLTGRSEVLAPTVTSKWYGVNIHYEIKLHIHYSAGRKCMPKEAPSLPLPSIRLDATAKQPLHHQLYEQLSQSIRSGHLKPGTRLPSTRALASELGVSRTTTIKAFRDLQTEGYIQMQIGAGTVVAPRLPELFLQTNTDESSTSQLKQGDKEFNQRAYPRLSQWGTRVAPLSRSSWLATTSDLRPFRIGAPALDAIPQQAWARAVNRAVRDANAAQLDYQHPAGHRRLCEELAAYLAVARGVRCTADQVIVVAGAQAGLSLAASVLLDAGDAVWMEDPGYFLAQAVFQAAAATVIPIPIDREGLTVAEGYARCPDARLAYVTPSHQFPLGVTMSHARRRQLLQWAEQADAWIIEDDYDSEYRYTGRPIPSLQGLDESGRVIYVGTFSKVFFPALRLGYIVAPPALVEPLSSAKRVMGFYPPVLEQMAMASFMARGEFTRHIRRMRGLYTERRDELLSYAAQYLGDKLRLERAPSGLHLVGWLPEAADEWELAKLADRHGVTVYPLSTFRLGTPSRPGLVLGFAAFRKAEIEVAVQKLARAWS